MMQEFIEQMQNMMEDQIGEVHTAMPATITSVDKGKGRVSAKPLGKFAAPTGKSMDYPIISDIPVIFPKSGAMEITYPIKAGDICLLVFSENELSTLYGGSVSEVALKYDMSSAICIPGLSKTPPSAFGGEDIVLKNGFAKVTVGKSSVEISLGGTTVNASSGGVQMTAGGTVLSVSSGGATVNGQKIKTE